MNGAKSKSLVQHRNSTRGRGYENRGLAKAYLRVIAPGDGLEIPTSLLCSLAAGCFKMKCHRFCDNAFTGVIVC